LVAQLSRDAEARVIKDEAARTMVEELDLRIDDLWEILQKLDSPDCTFFKSMPGKYVKAGDLDVYYVRHPNVATDIYLKLGITRIPAGTLNQVVVVYSFKKK
jgi:hypothetical protein